MHTRVFSLAQLCLEGFQNVNISKYQISKTQQNTFRNIIKQKTTTHQKHIIRDVAHFQTKTSFFQNYRLSTSRNSKKTSQIPNSTFSDFVVLCFHKFKFSTFQNVEFSAFHFLCFSTFHIFVFSCLFFMDTKVDCESAQHTMVPRSADSGISETLANSEDDDVRQLLQSLSTQ